MQMVFPQGLLGPMVSPENLWIPELSVKRNNSKKTGSYQQGGRENMPSIAVNQQLSQTQNTRGFHTATYLAVLTSCKSFPVLHQHVHAMVYPRILIFSSTFLTTSVQQTSHLFFQLQHSGQLTRDLKGSFFSMSSNITDSEISRSMLLILPHTYTAIHEEKGNRTCYRTSHRNGLSFPYNSIF